MRPYILLPLLIVLLTLGCHPRADREARPLDLLPDSTALVLSIPYPEQLRAELRNNALLAHYRKSLGPTPLESRLEEILALDPGQGALLAFTAREDTLSHWLLLFDQPMTALEDSLDLQAGESLPPEWALPEDSGLFTARKGSLRLVASTPEFLNSQAAENRFPELARALKTANSEAAVTLCYPETGLHPLEIFLLGELPEPAPGPQAAWTAYDLRMPADALFAQGLENRPDSLWDNRKLLRGIPPLPLGELLDRVPAGASSLAGFSLQDPGRFLDNQKEVRANENTYRALVESTEQLALAEWDGQPLLVLQALNAESLTEFLQPHRSGAVEFQGATLYELSPEAPIKQAFEPLLNTAPDWTHYARTGTTFLFGRSPETLRNTISAITRKDTYGQDPAFQAMDTYLTNASTAMALVENPSASGYFSDPGVLLGLPQKAASHLPEDYLYAAQINSNASYDLLEYQFRKKDDPSGSGKGVSQLLQLRLDGKVAAGPYLLKNHLNGQMDIAVQDDQNQLYLFSNTGKLFWKKTLKGPILGTIHQVDLFRNERLQMAFSLPDRVVVLDRNGNPVAPFPRVYEGGNLGALAVFDYENNRNYRLVVAQGSTIHMLDGQGRNVTGFKYRDAGSAVLGPAQHFRVGSRDYLVFRLENGRLEIRNRVGDTRVRVRETFDYSDNGVFLYRNTFAFTDRGGNLIAIDPQGKISRTPMNLNADHGMFATAKTLSLMDDNILRVRGNRAELELGVYTPPRMFYLNDIIYVAVTDIQTQQLFLFRSNAVSLPGFPVESNGLPDMADIDGDRNPELVVKFRDSSVAVYRLQR